MQNYNFLEWHPAMAQDILDLIKIDYLDRTKIDMEVEEGALINFDMSIEEWRKACDLVPWWRLGPHLNKWFHVNFKMSEWNMILDPDNNKSLKDLCDFISKQATMPFVKIRPIMGKECIEGSTFMAIKQLLGEAGVPVTNVRPSTKLAPFTRKYFWAFMRNLKRLAPNALPNPKIEKNFGLKLAIIFYWIGILGIISALLKSTVSFLMIFIVFGIISSIIAGNFPPKAVNFGKLETFRDLTYAFVNEIKKQK